MKHYLYVVDEDGNEIEGSRRPVDWENDREQYLRIRRELERAAGEGCLVRDSQIERR